MQKVSTYVGADGRTLNFVAKTGSGSTYDLTSLTVTLTAKLGATTKINDVAVTVDDASAGTFSYTPSASEIDEAGTYSAQVKIENGSATDFLEAFELEVLAVV